MFKPSVYQQAVFDYIEKETGSLIVQAVAGSGKTTTMLQAIPLIPNYKSITFVAFNKSIATNLKKKIPSHCQAKTYHGMGMSALLRWARQENNTQPGQNYVDQFKMVKIVRSLLGDHYPICGKAVIALVGYAKQMGIGFLQDDTQENFHALIDYFSIEVENSSYDYVARIAKQALEKSTELAALSIDFDDMVYLPGRLDLRLWQNDFVFVDEAQDTNPVQVDMLQRSLRHGGRLIAVGDRYQSIYAFRGADTTAMEKIKEAFHCNELPLSICYRCSKAVVHTAKKIVPTIETFENSLEGHVDSLSAWSVKVFNSRDGVLCRNTAPLIELAFACMAGFVPFRILGNDIGEGLIQLIDKLNAADTNELQEKLDAYYDMVRQRYTTEEQQPKLAAITDKLAALEALIDNSTSPRISALVNTIETIFNFTQGLTLCTVHKAKGLEFQRVFILDPFLMPSKKAKKDWEIQQETNLEYVAVTRAMHELYFIETENRVNHVGKINE